MRKYLAHFYIYISILLLGACGGQTQSVASPPATTTTTVTVTPPSFISETEAESLPMWIVIEREASGTGDLALLTILWAEDARIVDGRGTPVTEDDYIWSGRAAILDRYILAVFPSPPPPLTLDELSNATLTVEDDQATLINGGDRWRFVLREGRWWLHELVYSAP